MEEKHNSMLYTAMDAEPVDQIPLVRKRRKINQSAGFNTVKAESFSLVRNRQFEA
jgi:hypothetical protein